MEEFVLGPSYLAVVSRVPFIVSQLKKAVSLHNGSVQSYLSGYPNIHLSNMLLLLFCLELFE